MQFDFSDEETLSLLNLLVDTIEAERHPFSPRVEVLRGVLAKLLPRGREIYPQSGNSASLP